MPEIKFSSKETTGITKTQLYVRVFLVIVLIIVTSTAISTYFLIYKPQAVSTSPTDRPKPTPTPIPEYLMFLQARADYVGIIERIDQGNDTVTVLRDDGSRIQLTLNPFTHIYLVAQFQPQTSQVTISDQSALREQMVVSIYTQDKSIQALFALELDVSLTPTPPQIETAPINEDMQ
ncbi:hypothetical protein CO180_02465 [candidate division WWE3 bacterium CG_4_9_14_3_um_filter_41_6]|uniref:Uncharacterized protein n=1 Tax=candidate division WWE3 bacterium CG_4_10_14_0_2_um_filter_41_14 TaxID=1975072 RepID=A0A2M7TII8_UNCKA|nr:MAG: hypothetical protein COY32_03850 [candidate division WWE3 bacterium CG_4_10_14_0_2_um_filter_41_14]PJA38794.1 MAG: hypothetical protein CO180_02465 [candidate division WWE3 bacterium CG_4_9_14_3_um_filter_41_6]